VISLDYIAGFIDGEGCIGISMLTKRENLTFCPKITICNTDKIVLINIQKFLHEKFNTGGSLSLDCKHKKGKWKDAWVLCFGSKADLITLCTAIKSLLLIKAKQAQLILDFYNHKDSNHYRMTDDMRFHRAFIYTKMRQLNGKGGD